MKHLFSSLAVTACCAFLLGSNHVNAQTHIEQCPTAFESCKLQAEQGDPVAQYQVARALILGDGTVQNGSEGIKWLHQSAHQKYSPAYKILCIAYGKGQNVPINYVEAYRWCYLSAKFNGDETSIHNRDGLAKKVLSQSDLARAEHLINEFSSTVTSGTDYSPKGCDYAVTFPIQPVLARGELQGLETVIAKTPDAYTPFLRAECISMKSGVITEDTVRHSLLFQAKAIGIVNPMVIFEKSAIGSLAYVNGKKKVGQFNYAVILKTYRSSHSMLNLIVVDEVQNHPSPRSIEFFASARKINGVTKKPEAN
jgi:hypothetical protein